MKYTKKNLGNGSYFLMVTKEQIKELIKDGIIWSGRDISPNCTCICFEGGEDG